MSLVSSLRTSRQITGAWKSPNHKIVHRGAVTTLVRQIETEAARRGLSVSRWQTFRRGSTQIATVAWAIHREPKAARSSAQTDAIAVVRFAGAEGSTVQSVAYRQLSRLLAALRDLG
ncbi:MAG: hypothetical protein WCF99_17280 [Chloroflexales bacterium]